MSKNNRSNDQGVAGSTIADQIRANNAVPDGPANAAEIIESMIESQAEVLETIQADRAFYGPVECASADGNVTDRFGRKSCAAISVMVPIPLLGLKLTGTIWGRLVNDTNGTTVTFEGGMPKELKALDETGKDRLLAHMELGAQAWAGYEKTTDAVIAKLTGQTGKTVAGQLARPKLVKKVVLSAAPTA